MWAVYFLVKKNLFLKLLLFIVELIKELDSSNIFNGTIIYTNQPFKNEFLKVISHIIEEKIWKELFDVIAFDMIINKSIDITTTKYLDILYIFHM